MEAATEKEQGRNDSAGSMQGRNNLTPDFPNELPKTTPALERKISKRREAQEQRNVVLDLFKQLISKVNEGYSRVIAAQNNKVVPNKPSKSSKNKQKARPKEAAAAKESKQRARKSSSEELEPTLERKEDIWGNYSKLMSYEILMEELEPQQEVQQILQPPETQ